MEGIEIIFFIAFVSLFLFILFTRKGKNTFLRVSSGEIIKDFGDLGESKMGGFRYTIRLFLCKRGGETFYVLEYRAMLGVQYINISHEVAENLKVALSDENASI